MGYKNLLPKRVVAKTRELLNCVLEDRDVFGDFRSSNARVVTVVTVSCNREL